MACADVDMDIQRTDEEPHRADSGEPTMVRRYQATEVLPDDKGPLHDLLQKQPSVLGIKKAQSPTNIHSLMAYAAHHEELGFVVLLKTLQNSLQMVSGFLSVGVGILCAVTQQMDQSLFTLFRVSHFTGVLFIIAGVVSNLLFKYPRLLPLSFAVNCGCIIVTVAAACLIGVDLAYGNPVDEPYWRIEVLALCVMGLEVFLSAILCFWFSKEKRDKAP